MANKFTQEFVEKFLLEKKIKLHSTYVGANNKLEDVECLVCGFRDSRWKPTYNAIQCGNGCIKCAKQLTMKKEEVELFLLCKNIKLISTNFINVKQRLDIQCCVCCNLWKATFNNLQKGRGCSLCSVGKSQKKLFEILKKIENNWVVGYKGFEWLRGPKGRKMEIDCWNWVKKIAIERDGEQHYAPVKGWGGKVRFENLKERDQLKTKLISEHSTEINHFIRIPYWEPITEDNIRKILKENGVNL